MTPDAALNALRELAQPSWQRRGDGSLSQGSKNLLGRDEP